MLAKSFRFYDQQKEGEGVLLHPQIGFGAKINFRKQSPVISIYNT